MDQKGYVGITEVCERWSEQVQGWWCRLERVPGSMQEEP